MRLDTQCALHAGSNRVQMLASPYRVRGLSPGRIPRRPRPVFAASLPAVRSFGVDDEDEIVASLTEGNDALPPLVEVVTRVGEDRLKVVKPPGAEYLWDWYESKGQMEADPSWGKLWFTSRILASCVASCVESLPELRSKRVVEVGCGLGLAGLSAAMFGGSKSVIFCDREPLAIHCALSSAALNEVEVVAVDDVNNSSSGCRVAGALLDWSAPQTLSQPVDVVLGADCLYDPATAALLASACHALVAGDGHVVIAEPENERAKGCRQAFLEAALQSGATRAEVIHPPPEHQISPNGVLVIVCWSK